MPKVGTLNSGSKNAVTFFEKNIYIELPSNTEDITWFFTTTAITITGVHSVLTGSTSVDFQIMHKTDRSAGGNGVFSDFTVADSVAGEVQPTSPVTTVDNTVPSGSYIWIETDALSGNPTSLFVTLTYTED